MGSEVEMTENGVQVMKPYTTQVRSKTGNLHIYFLGRYSDVADKTQGGEKLRKNLTLPTSLRHKLGRASSRKLKLKAVVVHRGEEMKTGHYVAYLRDDARDGYIFCNDQDAAKSGPKFYKTGEIPKDELSTDSYIAVYEDVT